MPILFSQRNIFIVNRIPRRFMIGLAITIAGFSGATSEPANFFNQKVLPILEANCFDCHGDGKAKAGLRLTNQESFLKGGDQGSLIDKANPENSLLLAMISYRDGDHEMPPDGKLPEAQIETLTAWITKGAPFPADRLKSANPHNEAIETSPYDNQINDSTRAYWAYQRLTNQPVPVIEDPWATNPIDAFIYDKLQAQGLTPNSKADKRTLIRRAYYDLTGLPPTPAQMARWMDDNTSDAYERMIDELLASPHYGEKWGRHWLDLVRFAETNGYERDGPKANAWRYRDYVIRAFNSDKPYDQFITEQIAGDELQTPSHDAIIATGYLRLGIWDDEPVDPNQAFFDGLDDIVSTTSQAFLGTTLGCARCHDHKIDPLPQRDYYRFTAFFGNMYNNIQQRQFKKTPYTHNTQREIATIEERHARDLAVQRNDARLAELQEAIAPFEQAIYQSFSNPEKEDAQDRRTKETLIRQKAKSVLGTDRHNQYQALKREHNELQRNRIPSLPQALCFKENGPTPPDHFVHIRGNANSPGEKVTPGFPEVLGFPSPSIQRAPADAPSSGRRTVLANWLTSPENPLTARVMMNRIWQFHFGRGIVRSPNNFGQNGDAPTHPELLSWLAKEFIDSGWRMKVMHKKIMLSNTYQMSSRAKSEALSKDPENNLFWRYDMRRLTAEEIRDSVLLAAGRLNLEPAGPSIFTRLPREVLETSSRPDAAWGRSSEQDQYRRSIYIYTKRSLHEPMLKSFDKADTDSTCAVRFTTTVPTQALTMLNSEFLNEQASVLADRARNTHSNDIQEALSMVLQLTTNRVPSKDEIQKAHEMILELEQQVGLSEKEALDRFCLLALNLNEFVYLD